MKLECLGNGHAGVVLSMKEEGWGRRVGDMVHGAALQEVIRYLWTIPIVPLLIAVHRSESPDTVNMSVMWSVFCNKRVDYSVWSSILAVDHRSICV